MRVGFLGATGAVGREMWRLVEASDFPVTRVVPYTTARSAGTELTFRGSPARCVETTGRAVEALDLVLASAGAAAARAWAPRFLSRGATVVDNSSAFRQDPAVPLVVPELNASTIGPETRLVANPNCSTIQMVVALAPLHRRWGLTGVRVATYQSVSGAGSRAMKELETAAHVRFHGRSAEPEVFPHDIAFNVIPQVGDMGPDGESVEERKMRDETRRILDLPGLPVSAHCVRVPVFRGHSEAVWAAFEREPDPVEARLLLAESGVVVVDDPGRSAYPMPLAAEGRHEVFAGRIRRDPAEPRGLVLWIVADNLLKGAATNAVQIAAHLVERGWIPRGGA